MMNGEFEVILELIAAHPEAKAAKAQVDKLIEELEEFKKALTKYKECGPIALSHVAEEGADVNILMQPVIKALNIESMVKDWTNAKLKRLDKLTNKSSVG